MGDEPDQSWNFVIGISIFVLVLVGLFASGVVFFTTRGCTLPIDIVFGDTCFIGSLGASFGLTLVATIMSVVVFGLLGLVLNTIRNVIRRKSGDQSMSGDDS